MTKNDNFKTVPVKKSQTNTMFDDIVYSFHQTDKTYFIYISINSKKMIHQNWIKNKNSKYLPNMQILKFGHLLDPYLK